MNEILKDENYFSIHAWMVNKLNLSGNELLVYAVIYSFTENGVGEYMGTQKYLMEFTGIQSTQTIYKTLKKLIAKGYVTERSSNLEHGKANVYQAKTLEEILDENGDLGTYSPTFTKERLVCDKKDALISTAAKQGEVAAADTERAVFSATDNGYAKITDGGTQKSRTGYAKTADGGT